MDKPTDSEIIDRLGGTTEVARICQIKPPSVSEWRASGIPQARRQYLQLLRPDAFGSDEGTSSAAAVLVDLRMTKRALRRRLALTADAHLATVLGVPLDEVAAWPEDENVPALPVVLRLLGVETARLEPKASDDPDADRIIPVEAA